MFMIDHSAWSRIVDPNLDEDRVTWLAEVFEYGEIATCLPFLLEAGYSARSGSDYQEVSANLTELPRIPISEDVERLALEAQQDLARIGHHRMAPIDLIIAACAHVARAGVLHYDRDFDRIAEHTRLRFHSEWLAPVGTL
jgi:predicted nucleic acid-binding protein